MHEGEQTVKWASLSAYIGVSVHVFMCVCLC